MDAAVVLEVEMCMYIAVDAAEAWVLAVQV